MAENNVAFVLCMASEGYLMSPLRTICINLHVPSKFVKDNFQ